MASKEELPNCRIFIGNLASEKTSKEEIARIFGKYGQIVEEPVLRKSFGFVQYNNPQSAIAAINGENGRLIGGLRIGIFFHNNFTLANITRVCFLSNSILLSVYSLTRY
jgi:RNA recognition motif-containing protein